MFTVDFSIVVVTNLHRLTEYFIIKIKMQKNFKSSHQRRIQNPVKAGDGDSFENSQPLFSQKAPPQMPNQQSDCTFSDNLTSLITIAILD